MCTNPCNFCPAAAYTVRDTDAKEEQNMGSANSGDLDDLIFEDSWQISDR